MKILVLSDSHSSLWMMRKGIAKTMPDAVIHLGDFYDDGGAMAEENPGIPFYQVPGNCDRYWTPADAQEILYLEVGGAILYLTHGHRHGVKYGTAPLLAAAREAGAHAVLYGHTHRADCRREADGLWVLNPGSCGYGGGTVGMLEIKNGEITACRILSQADLEEME